MKYLHSINEFSRTIGFRYSEPKIRFNIIMFCKGELDEEQFSSLMSHIDVKFENLAIIEETKEIELEGDVVIETNLAIEFDVLVYNESEMETVQMQIQNGLNRELNVQTYEFYYKLAPVLGLKKEEE